MAVTEITRTAIVDDDGTLTTGTVINNAWKQELYDQIDALLAGAIETGGALKIAGALTVTGGQIVFPSTQVASTDPNTLDDYEEGTFTPVIGGAGGTSGQTYSFATGRYEKLGKYVVAWFDVLFTAKGTITGNVQLQGLPFASQGSTVAVGGGHVYRWGGLSTNAVALNLFVNTGTTTADLYIVTAAAAASANAAAGDIGNSTRLAGAIVYNAGS